MTEARFTNRELTLMFNEIKETLVQHGEVHKKILEQTTYTNGKVRRLHGYLLVIGTATLTLLFTNGSELIGFIKLII